MKFLINSHIDSFNLTFKIVTESLVKSGISKDDIIFFIGGYEDYENRQIQDINVYNCNHNSIDFTTLISIIDLNLEIDNCFIMHDTSYVGENFYSKISSVQIDCPTISLTFDGYSMNTGLYTRDHIFKNKDRILSIKNSDYRLESLQHWKKIAVDNEDIFLNPKIKAYNYSNRIYLGKTDFYKTGTMRMLEYFPDIDFFKVKANWEIKEVYELNL